MDTTDPRRRNNRILCFVIGFTIGVAGIVGSAAHAEAKPIKESTIKSECKDAGGTYSTSTSGGTRFSTCTYLDNEGNQFVDYYANGNHYSTRP